MKLGLYLTPYAEMNSGLSKDLFVKGKILTILEENTRQWFYDLGAWKFSKKNVNIGHRK